MAPPRICLACKLTPVAPPRVMLENDRAPLAPPQARPRDGCPLVTPSQKGPRPLVGGAKLRAGGLRDEGRGQGRRGVLHLECSGWAASVSCPLSGPSIHMRRLSLPRMRAMLLLHPHGLTSAD